MKKRFAAVFAATAVLGVTTAFAANPFSDVTPNDWAYQAVAQLASQGVINGYPDGTFKGQNNITRYEMAQMIAKAMARQDRVDAEQNAMINRLANEFSAELNNLGVRVGKLEDKVGNFKFTGDARLKYDGYDKLRTEYDADGKAKTLNKSTFKYRGRVQFDANVNDNTTATVRIVAGDHEFGDSNATEVTADRVYVSHNFGDKINAKIGRHDLTLASGLTYDDTFDGASVKVGTDKLYASAAYGYLAAGDFSDKKRDDNAAMTALQLGGKVGQHVDVKGYYVATHKDGYTVKRTNFYTGKEENATLKNFFGGSLDANFGAGDKIWVGGEYARAEATGAKGEAWVAGVGYGNYDMEKQGTWGVKAQYFDLGKEAPVYSSTWNQPANQNWKGWLATVDYAVAKNVGLSAYATFDSKNQDKDNNDNLPEYYRAELNYKF